MSGRGNGLMFVHVPIKAFNSDSPNITMTASEIRDRFISAFMS